MSDMRLTPEEARMLQAFRQVQDSRDRQFAHRYLLECLKDEAIPAPRILRLIPGGRAA